MDRLPRVQTVGELRALLAVVDTGKRELIAGGVLLIPFALIMATQYWSLTDGWIAASIALVLLQGAAGAVVNSRVRRLHSMVLAANEPEGELPANVAALAQTRFVQGIDRAAVANLIEIVFVMTVKPVGSHLVLCLVATALAAFALGATAYRPSRASS